MVKITEKLSNLLYKTPTPKKKEVCNKSIASILSNLNNFFNEGDEDNAGDNAFDFNGSYKKLEKSITSYAKSEYLGKSLLGKVCDSFFSLFGKSEKQTLKKRIEIHVNKVMLDYIDARNINRVDKNGRCEKKINFFHINHKILFYESFNLSGTPIPVKLKKDFGQLRASFLKEKTERVLQKFNELLNNSSSDTDILATPEFDKLFSEKNQEKLDRLFLQDIRNLIVQKNSKNSESVKKIIERYRKFCNYPYVGISSRTVQETLKKGVEKKCIAYIDLQNSAGSKRQRLYKIVDYVLSFFGMSLLQRAKRNYSQKIKYREIESVENFSFFDCTEFFEKIPVLQTLQNWYEKEEDNLSHSIKEQVMRICIKFDHAVNKEIYFNTLSKVFQKDEAGNFTINDPKNLPPDSTLVSDSFCKKENAGLDKFFTKIQKEAAKNPKKS